MSAESMQDEQSNVAVPQRGVPPMAEADADVSMLPPPLREAHRALGDGRLDFAEQRLRSYLEVAPADVNALKMLAEVALRSARDDDAEALLVRCLELAPRFADARYRYALLLNARDRLPQALAQLDELLRSDQQNVAYLGLKAVTLGKMGEYDRALRIHEALVREYPERYPLWSNYATDLRSAGRSSDSIAAYRKAIELNPGFCDAYWSLANFKTFRFAPAEIDAMSALLEQPELSAQNRSLLHFALGKALEDSGHYEESFDHYRDANEIQRAARRYRAAQTTKDFARLRGELTAQFFAERRGAGCSAGDPIFILGLPRSGSTLVEQILASHSAIEGTRELSNIRRLAGGLEGEYPDALLGLGAEAFKSMGEEYLEDTRIHRRLGRPFFTDKAPQNFAHIGLIHLILPNAKIIDVRRHPLDCCWSNFRQLYGRAFAFSYSLTDLGRYCRDYVELMAHYDEVLPGTVHRVIYEQLVGDPDTEVRRLFDYLNLPFEKACLRFYETGRAVSTSSSEQVRLPIFKDAIGYSRNFDPWLADLKSALGPVLDAWPNVPDLRSCARSGTDRAATNAKMVPATLRQPSAPAISSDEAKQFLATNPSLAEARAREILAQTPGNPGALLLLGAALQRQGDAASAKQILEPLARAEPHMGAVLFELGLALTALGNEREAVAALERAIDLDPRNADAWRALGERFPVLPGGTGDEAPVSHSRTPAIALRTARTDSIENSAHELAECFPTDIDALALAANDALRQGRLEEAEALLTQYVEHVPDFPEARFRLATVLLRLNKISQTIAQLGELLKRDSRNEIYRGLRAGLLVQMGQFADGAAEYEILLQTRSDRPGAWMSYGHALKALGRHHQSVAAYRTTIELLPALGEAWCSLANFKTYRFEPQEIGALRMHLARPHLQGRNRGQLLFALGKALEDAHQFAESFACYRDANALLRHGMKYDADGMTDRVRRSKALFTPGFFRERAEFGCKADAPIFVVGLPRSGSTLVEQILASHSAIEATAELHAVPYLAGRIGGRNKLDDASVHYPESLANLDAQQLQSLGEEYMGRTRARRKLGRPFFIDKMPHNFAHIGFIHLMLPNAKFVDVRRHPLGCCFSNFRQHFSGELAFAYSLSDLGRYYRDYVELMAHFDDVLPGRVHRVTYEQLVEDPEGEVRRLLAWLGLQFEAGCLRFHESGRVVATASSDQVRMPIFTDALEHWRNYEPWLAPLKIELGAVLDAYPDVPDYHGARRPTSVTPAVVDTNSGSRR